MASEKSKVEERRISPAIIIIPLGLGLGAAAVLGLAAMAGAAVTPTPPSGRAALYGKVTDSQTGAAVAGALLALDGVQTYTDTGGNYTFSDVAPGGYTLTVTKSGWISISESITLPEGTTQLNIPMVSVAAQDQFYMPPTLQVSEAGPVNGEYTLTFSIRITNKGTAAGTYQLTWGSNEFTPEYEVQATRIITIKAGESYDWTWTWTEIPDYYRGYFTVQLFGDWATDNSAIRVWT